MRYAKRAIKDITTPISRSIIKIIMEESVNGDTTGGVVMLMKNVGKIANAPKPISIADIMFKSAAVRKFFNPSTKYSEIADHLYLSCLYDNILIINYQEPLL